MNGNKEYTKKYKDKINRLYELNPDKKYLKSFCNFLSDASELTKYNYLNYVIRFMNYIKKDVSELDLDDYTEYLSTFEDCTPSNRIVTYSGLKKFSLYLKASGKNDLNAMQYVARPNAKEKQETKMKREISYLNEEELNKYLEEIDLATGKIASRDRAIIYLFLNTGLRCSGLYKLDVDNVDLINKKIITTDKREEIQEYDLSDEMIEVLKEWLYHRRQMLMGKNEDALFISTKRTRISHESIAYATKKFGNCINKGIKISPHKLRATFGTTVFSKTHDIYVTQKAMKHSNPQTTELYVRGQENECRRKATNIMNEATLRRNINNN